MAEVMLIRWPEDGEDGLRLAGAGVAVLYLIDGDHDPPTPTTCLEDWIRIPGDERDMRARVGALEFRALAHLGPPWVDDHGRLHYLAKTIPLPDDEARVARVLTERFGELVDDEQLGLLANGRSLRTVTTELRSRLREMGLNIRRVRGRGYRLQRR
jgi:hypothetical protein